MGTTLITGVTGFAGSHLAGRLLAGGESVVGLARGTGGEGGRRLDPRVVFRAADVRDIDAVAALLAEARPERVFHLAGQASPRRSFEDPLGTHEANYLGTAALLAAVRRSGMRPRVLFASSAECYGASAADFTDRAMPEETPLRPLSPYGASKAAAEILCALETRTGGTPVVCVRSFNHTGAGQTGDLVGPSFARQVAEAEAGLRPPEIRVGNLDGVRDFSDVRDVVAAYDRILDRGEPGAVYNVCSGRPVVMRSFLERLLALARVPIRVVHDPARARPVETPRLVGDPARLRAATGLTFETPLEETLGALLESWRERVAEARN